jgi:RNA polymerase sigma-70 factor (sigma-E family)
MRRIMAGEADPLAAPTIAELFRERHAELVRLAVMMVGDQATAEDIVQDVFARLQARWDQVAESRTLLAYVRSAVLNGCKSALRRRGIARRVAQAQEALAKRQDLDSAEQEVIAAEDRRRLLTALAKLPRRRREVLVLRYYLDLSETEIAAVLGISNGTVKSNAARGLAALARIIGDDDEQDRAAASQRTAPGGPRSAGGGAVAAGGIA